MMQESLILSDKADAHGCYFEIVTAHMSHERTSKFFGICIHFIVIFANVKNALTKQCVSCIGHDDDTRDVCVITRQKN